MFCTWASTAMRGCLAHVHVSFLHHLHAGPRRPALTAAKEACFYSAQQLCSTAVCHQHLCDRVRALTEVTAVMPSAADIPAAAEHVSITWRRAARAHEAAAGRAARPAGRGGGVLRHRRGRRRKGGARRARRAAAAVQGLPGGPAHAQHGSTQRCEPVTADHVCTWRIEDLFLTVSHDKQTLSPVADIEQQRSANGQVRTCRLSSAFSMAEQACQLAFVMV